MHMGISQSTGASLQCSGSKRQVPIVTARVSQCTVFDSALSSAIPIAPTLHSALLTWPSQFINTPDTFRPQDSALRCPRGLPLGNHVANSHLPHQLISHSPPAFSMSLLGRNAVDLWVFPHLRAKFKKGAALGCLLSRQQRVGMRTFLLSSSNDDAACPFLGHTIVPC